MEQTDLNPKTSVPTINYPYSTLPTEILRKIFHKLNFTDLKSAVLVCTRWRSVGEDPSFWSWCWIKVTNGIDMQKLSKRRFQNIRHIHLSLCGLKIEELLDCFNSMTRLPKLRTITDSGLTVKVADNMTDIDWQGNSWISLEHEHKQDAILSALCTGGNMRSLSVSTITHTNADTVFSAIVRGGLVKSVKISYSPEDLPDSFELPKCLITPELLASALCRLEELDLKEVRVTKKQVLVILESIASAEGQCTLKKLVTGKWWSLRGISLEVLTSAVCRLVEVDMSNTKMSQEQALAVLTAIGNQSDINLKHLVMGKWPIQNVSPQLLSRVVSRLEVVEMGNIRDAATEELSTAVFEGISWKQSLTKKLGMCGEIIHIKPELFTRAVCRLEEISLSNSTEKQTHSLFMAISRKQSVLKKLSFWNWPLNCIEPELITRAFMLLEEVDMSYQPGLEEAPTLAVLAATGNIQSVLKKLKWNVSLCNIAPEALATALCRLEKVNIERCGLTAEQVDILLKKCLDKESKLKQMFIGYWATNDNPRLQKARERGIKIGIFE